MPAPPVADLFLVRRSSMQTVIDRIEAFGAGLFVRSRNIESRLTQSDVWRAFQEPVIVWVRNDEFDDASLQQLIGTLRGIPTVSLFRFSATRVTAQAARVVLEFWPETAIEGVPSA